MYLLVFNIPIGRKYRSSVIANFIMYVIANWINLCPIGSTIGFANTYQLDSDFKSAVDSTIQRLNYRGIC